ncbi:MAG: 3-deoxy-7-phosphoheptulonate synthase [Vampirovibrionales bacterium]|nr:3-deoxy-7-phosphoheptulonate synthase [Vampirovibrionales bacterium]
MPKTPTAAATLPIKKFVRRQDAHQTVVAIGEARVGGPEPVLMAGPCAVESLEQLRETARTLQALGIHCLRAGAFKPRTSPYAFQGMGMAGIELLSQIRDEFDLAIISEVMSAEQIAPMAPHIDCFQVGSRNMQNFDLLKALGRQNKPVLLKRGLAATLEEFLWAAEYILEGGNPHVILCERGIRSFDSATRNVFDLAAVALLRERTHLPVIADPSHATGKRSLVLPCARAAIAVGAQGLIVEAHPQPEKSVSDADQALSFPELGELARQTRLMASALSACATPAPEKLPQASRATA